MVRQSRTSTRAVCALGIAFTAAATLEACSTTSRERVETSSERLVIPPNAIINPAPITGVESAAAIVFDARNRSKLVVTNNLGPHQNALCLAPNCPDLATLAWNVSSSRPTFSTGTWTQHFEYQNCNDLLFDDPSCILPSAPCPCANRGARPLLGDRSPYQRSDGDTTLVATGRPGQLAMLSPAASTTNNDVDVVMAVSIDSGGSFGHLVRISDSTSDAVLSACYPGESVDQPKIVMMGTTSHVAYVYWTAGDLEAGTTSTCFRHPFARRVFFPPNNAAPVLSGIYDLNHSSIGKIDATNQGSIEPVCTVTNDNCVNGSELLTVVWPTHGSSGLWATGECANNTMSATTVDVVWRWGVRDMIANSWYHSPDNLVEDTFSPTCVIVGAVGNPIGNQRITPTMTQDTNLFPGVHVFLSGSKYFNNTGLPADNRGTRIIHAQINLQNGATASTFEELSPVTSVCTASINCTNPVPCTTVHVGDECYVEQFAPSAANNGFGTMAVAWHDTRLSPHMWSDATSSRLLNNSGFRCSSMSFA